MKLSVLTTIAAIAFAATPARAMIDTNEALKQLGFPADTLGRVLVGQFVETALPASSERDLNVGIAFLVQTAPEKLTRQLFEEMLLQRVDPSVIGSGKITGDGAKSITKLTLSLAQQQAYAKAAPGDVLNLSAAEIEFIRSAGADAATIWNRVRDALIERYSAYRTKGLKGIAPYTRKDGTRSPADEIAGFNKTSRTTGLLPASFYNLLDGYPPGTPPQLTESYTWSEFKAHDVETIALVHAWVAKLGDALVGVQRQYYVSGGYNAEQAIAGFIPVEEGTLVIYTNHTSTDQVTGIGGGAKRSIGRKVLASELQKLFEKVNAAVKAKP